MKKLYILAAAVVLMPLSAPAAETAKSIIQKVDQNQVFTTQEFKAVMTITKGKRRLVKTFFGFGKKDGTKSFMEFTNPEDLGVKYLKIADELWIYFPDADDIMKISGHMLRQGMMGSDISYEDMLENDSIEEKYQSERLEDQKIGERDCFVIKLTAKKPDATYAKQIIFVDQIWFLPLKIELFARGGRLLKTMTQAEVKKIGARWVPNTIHIRDMRKKNSETTITFDEIVFDKKVPARVFTKGYLKR